MTTGGGWGLLPINKFIEDRFNSDPRSSNANIIRSELLKIFFNHTPGIHRPIRPQVLSLADYLKQEKFKAFFETVQAIYKLKQAKATMTAVRALQRPSAISLEL